VNRHVVFAFGLAMLLVAGPFAQGCDSSRKANQDGAVDVGGQAGSSGGARGTGGATGTGGVTSTGGAQGTGGASGSGGMTGTGGASGTGGRTGTGGASGTDGGPAIDAGMTLDVGIDGAAGVDTNLDGGRGADTSDASITTDLPTDGSSEASSTDTDAGVCPAHRPGTHQPCDIPVGTSCIYYDSPIYPGGMVVCMCGVDGWICYI
jgi:hypothetical protein